MTRFRARTGVFVAGGCVIATLVATSAAQSAKQAVTASSITKPKDLTYLVYNATAPNTFAVSGTSNGTSGDHVDLRCYDGNGGSLVAGNVALGAGGSFSVPAAPLQLAKRFRVCNLRAVPAGTTPSPAPFSGPRLLVGYAGRRNVSGGPNNGTLYDYDLFFQQLAGGGEYFSLSSCGIGDGYLLDSSDALSTTTWFCNATFFNENADQATRSGVQVDAANAYGTWGAQDINPQASGLPALKYSYSVNAHTGDGVIHETSPLVKCTKATYPPTSVSCAKFVSTGVTDLRTITQDHDGRVSWITDVFKSTDGHAHTVDFLWVNQQRFRPSSTGDSSQIEYEFPGEHGYSKRAAHDSVKLPAKPGTIFIRVHGAADGTTSTGQGAIVYDRPATAAKFVSVSAAYEWFSLHQKANVPANGSTRFRFAYVDDLHAAVVASLAQEATTVFKGCTVPNVVGKSLRAAKKAITHAHCAVGKIAHAHSATVPRGHVVAEKPKAKTTVDYGTKVSLVVSK